MLNDSKKEQLEQIERQIQHLRDQLTYNDARNFDRQSARDKLAELREQKWKLETE